MLKKSVKSAFILSGLTVASFNMVSAVLNILIPYLVSSDVHDIVARPEALNTPGDILALVGLVVTLLLILTGIGAFWLYKFFGDKYYGTRGAIRWALFGATLALLLSLPNWLIPERWWLLRYIWRFGSVFVAFFLIRKIMPLKR